MYVCVCVLDYLLFHVDVNAGSDSGLHTQQHSGLVLICAHQRRQRRAVGEQLYIVKDGCGVSWVQFLLVRAYESVLFDGRMFMDA